MAALNHLIMALIIGFLLLAVNQYIPLTPLITLVFNYFMIVLIVVYLMQCIGVIKDLLPVFKVFR
jgi:hypothetical protein